MKLNTIFLLLIFTYANNDLLSQENFIINHGDSIISDAQIGSMTRGKYHFQHFVSPASGLDIEREQLLVNTVTGNLLYSRTDFRSNDIGFPIHAKFTYNSLSSFNGRFGAKWQFSYNVRYTTNNVNKKVIIVLSDDKTELFQKRSDSAFHPIYGATGKLRFDDGKYVYSNISNDAIANSEPTYYHFAEPDNHYVSNISDNFGNEIKFEYKHNRLTQVLFPSGNKLSMSYSGEKLTKLRFGDILEISYEYDESDNLTKVIYPDGTFYSYEYDDCNLLSKIIFPAGNSINIEYAPDLSVKKMDVGSNLNYAFVSNRPFRTFKVILPNETNYQFDSDTLYRTTRITKANGNTLLYSYNDKYELTAVENPDESTTRYFYNDLGLLAMTINPLNRQSLYSYDSFGNLLEYTDAETNKWRFSRNESGIINKVTNGNKNFDFDFDNKGILKSFEIDELRIRFDNDSRGNPTRIAFSDYILYDFRYDHLGYISSFTQPDRIIYVIENNFKGLFTKIAYPNQSSKEFEYINSSNLSKVTLNDGVVVNFLYDNAMRPKSFKLGNFPEFIVDYKNSDTIIFRTPITSQAQLVYGKNRRLASLFDFNNIEYKYDYDKRDNLIAEYIGNHRVSSRIYNLNNEMTESTVLGFQERLAYDKLSRLISYSNPTGTKLFQYDAFSNLTNYTSPSNVQYVFQYDFLNNLGAVLRNSQTIATFNYDLYGNLISVNKPGQLHINYENDELGLAKTATINNGTPIHYRYNSLRKVSSINNGMNELTYTYDKMNRISGIKNDNIEFRTYSYNQLGKVREILNQDLQKVSYDYNAMGSLSQITQNGTTHKFMNSPKLLEISYYDDFIYTYGFNDFYKLVSVSNATNDEIRFIYDDSERLSEIFADGLKFGFTYSNSLLISSYTNGDNSRVSLNYSPIGNLIAIIDPNLNSTGILYNVFGDISNFVDSQNRAITFQYENDLLSKISFSGGDSIRYIYNQYGQKIRKITERAFATNYEYNSFGLLSKVYDANMSKYFSYDKDMKLAQIVNELNDTLKITNQNNRIKSIQLYDFDLTVGYLNGKLVSIDLNGTPFSRMTYDNFAFVNSYTYLSDYKINLNNNHIGLLNQKTDYNNNTVVYFRNNIGRTLRKNFHDATSELYSYTNSGKISALIDRTSSEFLIRYDKAKRPISFVVNRFDSLQYVYNSVGEIIRIAEPMGNSFEFRYNAFGNLTAIISPNAYHLNFRYNKQANDFKMFDKTGDTTTFRLDNYYRIVSKIDNIGRLSNLRYDNFGNRLSIAQNGDTCYFYRDDKYGRIINSTNGSSSNLYSFIGKQLKPSSISAGGVEYAINSSNKLFETRVNNVLQSTVNFNLNHNITSISIPTIGTYNYFYDVNQNLSRISHSNKNLINFKYSPIGELEVVEYNSLKYVFSYDTKINLQSIEKAGKKYSYYYDGNSNLIIKDYPTGFDNFFEYDVWNRLKIRFDQSGNVFDYTYTDIGQSKTISKTSPENEFITNEYDKAGRLQFLKNFSNGQENIIAYQYDNHNNLKSLALNGQSVIQINKATNLIIDTVKFGANQTIIVHKNKNELPLRIQYDDEFEVQYDYDLKNRLNNVSIYSSGNFSKSYNYNYDNADRLLKISSNTDTSLLALSYNEWSEYTKVSTNGNSTIFVQDNTGRILSRNDNGKLQYYSYASNSNIPHKIGDAFIYTNESENVSSITNGDEQFGFFYDNEDQLIGYSRPDGDFITFRYNNEGLLSKSIGNDTVHYFDIAIGSQSPQYFAVTKNSNSLKINNYFYRLFEKQELLFSLDTNGNPNHLIKDAYGNLLAYTSADSIVYSEYFTYDIVDESKSPNPLYKFRNLVSIPGTDLFYDGVDFYHRDFKIFITRNKRLERASSFLPTHRRMKSKPNLSDLFKYHIDSGLIVGGSDKYSEILERIKKDNLIEEMIDEELNLQYNHFQTYKVKSKFNQYVTKFKFLSPKDINCDLIVNASTNKEPVFAMTPKGMNLLGDTVFKQAYKEPIVYDYRQIPRYTSNRIENILSLMEYLKLDDDDQFVRILNLINRLLTTGKYELPSNITDISPICIDFLMMDSIMRQNDYVRFVVDASEPIDDWQESLNNLKANFEMYQNEIRQYETDTQHQVDILNPGFKLYKPNFDIPSGLNHAPSVFYDFLRVNDENISNVISKMIRIDLNDVLDSKWKYDSRIELPYRFDTLDDLNLRNIRPIYQNYFRFLR
jgi:YD repeat-containing protein